MDLIEKINKIPNIILRWSDGSYTAENEYFRLHACGTLPVADAAAIPPIDCRAVILSCGGDGTVTASGCEYRLNKSEFTIFDCSYGLNFKAANRPCEFFLIFISGDGAKHLLLALKRRSPNGFSLRASPDVIIDFEKIYTDFPMYSSDLFRFLNMFSSVIIRSADFSANLRDTEIPAYLEDIKRMFDTGYYNSYSLDSLEHKFHVNKYKIAKDFTAHYGCAPIAYLNNRRVEAAKTLLLGTNSKINEISFMVGIETVNHFINIFKKRVGITPAAYRKKFK